MKSIGWGIAELWPFEVFHTRTGHRTPDIEHTSDFIFCPMLLCIALDRQWFCNKGDCEHENETVKQ